MSLEIDLWSKFMFWNDFWNIFYFTAKITVIEVISIIKKNIEKY